MDYMEILFLALGAFLLFGSDLVVAIMSLKGLGAVSYTHLTLPTILLV